MFDEDGIDPKALVRHKFETGAVANFPGSGPISNEDVQQQLDRKMTAAYHAVAEMSKKAKVHNRVAEACKIRGWV